MNLNHPECQYDINIHTVHQSGETVIWYDNLGNSVPARQFANKLVRHKSLKNIKATSFIPLCEAGWCWCCNLVCVHLRCKTWPHNAKDKRWWYHEDLQTNTNKPRTGRPLHVTNDGPRYITIIYILAVLPVVICPAYSLWLRDNHQLLRKRLSDKACMKLVQNCAVNKTWNMYQAHIYRPQYKIVWSTKRKARTKV